MIINNNTHKHNKVKQLPLIILKVGSLELIVIVEMARIIKMINHKIIFTEIHAASFNSLAHSEDLLNTSNCVFSKWQLNTYFGIANKKPYAIFEITDKAFSRNVIFKTESYEELESWINEHISEIQAQIDTKANNWIEEHKNLFNK